MRIFLSHASEQRSQAERLALALQARRHQVFLDIDDLPPSGDYQSRIQAAIQQCDLFCFLISPESVAAGRFTLSEVGFARRRWPDPTGRVVPIMVAKVPIDSVPPYLRAVSIFSPEGDLVADSVVAIEALRPKRSRALAFGLAGVGIVAVVGAAYVATSHLKYFSTPGASNQPLSAAPDSAREKTSSNLHIPAAENLQRAVAGFIPYMTAIGFRNLDDNVTVNLYSKTSPLPGDLSAESDTMNAFYRDGTLNIHFALSGDMSVLLREYTHHALSKTVAPDMAIGNSEVESGLADYFPASFLNSPLLGDGLGKLFNLPTTYIRRLDNDRLYTSVEDEPHARGEVWGGALWACRQALGQAAVDKAPVNAWMATMRSGVTAEAHARFGAALAATAGPAGKCLAQEIQRRHLPH
jgi:hypothetical protein